MSPLCPPAAKTLESRIERLCDFANAQIDEGPFIHPILKAIIIHFVLAYDHPFVDGNGRTARALFYWSALRDDYWLLEYISISKIINEAPTQYGKAFLYSETDDGDLTYFLIHQLQMISRALEQLNDYLETKSSELHQVKAALEQRPEYRQLNHRHVQLIEDAIKNPSREFLIEEHRALHSVSYLTARSDLERLAELKLFSKKQRGRSSIYQASKMLAKKLTGERP